MKQRILILGANGQVGRALNMLAEGDVVALTRAEADLSKPQSLRGVIDSIQPDVILNAAAYTAVDKAEEEEALATVINGEAPGVLAEIAVKRNIPLVHYSTDYVFNGSGDKPWREDDKTAPLNAYGRSKLAGEQAIEAAGGKYLIFRISWVYDAYGKNFLNTMLRLGKDRETLKVVDDQFGAPCYAPHIAAATLQAVEQLTSPSGRGRNALGVSGEGRSEPASPHPRIKYGAGSNPLPEGEGISGIYHIANAGETSWHGFATAIFDEARKKGIELSVKDVLPIPASEYPTPAKRPANSRMDCGKFRETFGITLPVWQEGLKAAIAEVI